MVVRANRFDTRFDFCACRAATRVQEGSVKVVRWRSANCWLEDRRLETMDVDPGRSPWRLHGPPVLDVQKTNRLPPTRGQPISAGRPVPSCSTHYRRRRIPMAPSVRSRNEPRPAGAAMAATLQPPYPSPRFFFASIMISAAPIPAGPPTLSTTR